MARTRKADALPASTAFPIRFREADLGAIKRAAAARGETPAQFIRTAALTAAELLGCTPVEEPSLLRRVEYLEKTLARHEVTLAWLAKLKS